MINANELRIGNWVRHTNTFANPLMQVIAKDFSNELSGDEFPQFDPIPLTPEVLEACGFKKMPHFTVGNNISISLGRDRVLSVSSAGTPNEMVFITEEQPPEVKNIIVARNYDYDGKTYVHHLQNIFSDLTGHDLPITNLNANK